MILNTNFALVALLLAFVYLAVEVDGQSARCNRGTKREQCRSVGPGDPRYESFKSRACDFRIREIDGACTNEREKVWGAAGTTHFSNFDADTTIPTGTTRESSRLISNIVSSQRDNMFNDRRLSELLAFFGQFLNHNIAQSPDSNQAMDIEIPRDDPLFGNFTSGRLPFLRSNRETVSDSDSRVRPANILSSAIDLAAVYSPSRGRLESLREGNDCKLKTSANNNLPLNEEGIVNAPSPSSAFFIAGDIRVNENPILTSFHLIFLREHNRLCDELISLAPNEERRFQLARQMNIAQFQKIVFDEFVPAITGRNLPAYTGHKEDANAGVSLVFSTAAFRVGHSMIGNEVQLRGPGNVLMASIPAREMFFLTASFFTSTGPEAFIRGAARQRAQELDTQVMDSLRQILFSNVPGLSTGIDLIAINLQRGRDHALPTYNTVRTFFGLPTVSSFTQMTSNAALQARLQAVYNGPNDMDLWVALLAEDHEPGSSMGPTMLRIWLAEFARFRDADRLYYENGARRFLGELIEFNGGLRTLRRQRNLLRQIILRNTNIADADLPPSVFMM